MALTTENGGHRDTRRIVSCGYVMSAYTHPPTKHFLRLSLRAPFSVVNANAVSAEKYAAIGTDIDAYMQHSGAPIRIYRIVPTGILLMISVLSAVLATSLLGAPWVPAAHVAEPVTWKIDVTHSELVFRIRHFYMEIGRASCRERV